jgi:PhzF family phenazine biosynthesis protein
LDADTLSNKQMLQIAAELKCSETAFVMQSGKADYRVRFFSPAMEVPLCGHGTIAMFHVLGSEGLLAGGAVAEGLLDVSLETNVGVLPIQVGMPVGGKVDEVIMHQLLPTFANFKGTLEDVARGLGIAPVGIVEHQIEVASTGNPSLKVPLKSIKVMASIKPDFDKVLELCRIAGTKCVHVYTLETSEPGSTAHCRNFASGHGVLEDPVTGTASGSLGCYLMKNIIDTSGRYLLEQGYEIGRKGKVRVFVDGSPDKITGVRISGQAITVFSGKARVV